MHGLESPVSHSFLVVKSLISPVIVGVDFLQQQHLSLDFSYCPVRVHHSSQEAASHNSSSEQKKYSSTTAAISSKNAEPEGNEDLQIEQCAIPKFKKTDDVTLPEVEDKTLRHLLEKYKDLFRNSPGVTTLTHIISFQPLDHLSGYHLAVFQQSIDRKWTSSSRIC